MNEKEYEHDIARVRQGLKEAFADVPNPIIRERVPPIIDDNAVILDDDADLRRNLMTFTREDFQFVLPEVLADLLDTDDREGVESVIRTLNVLCDEPAELSAEAEKLFGKEIEELSRIRRAELRDDKLQHFANFTYQQAAAIRDWLLVAKTWQELEDEEWAVNAALQYWAERTNTIL